MKKHITYTHFLYQRYGKTAASRAKRFFNEWGNDSVSDSQCGSLTS